MAKIIIDCDTNEISSSSLTDQEIAANAILTTTQTIINAKAKIPGDLNALYLALPLSNRTDPTWGYVYKAQIISALSIEDYAGAQAMLTALVVPSANQAAQTSLLAEIQTIINSFS